MPGSRSRAAAAILRFASVRGAVPLAEAGLDQGERRPGRHGAAVHAAEHAGPLEHGEVAPHGLGGDAEPLGDRGDGHPAALGDQTGDGVLTFLGVHAHLPATALGCPVLWVCDCYYVVLRGIC